MQSIFVKHAEWGRIVSSQVDYEGRLFGVEVFMRLVIRELKVLFFELVLIYDKYLWKGDGLEFGNIFFL